MHSDVRLTVGPGGVRGMRVHEMVECAPVAWRRTPDAVYMVGTAASPVGRDDLTVSVRVLAGASLTLRSAAASVLWSGAGTRQQIRVTVEEGAELVWSPEAMIATAGCAHRQLVSVELHPTARLRWRELVVLGRHGEAPGDVESRLRVTVAGTPVLHHVVAAGSGLAAWNGPAVLGSTKVLGQLVLAGPGMTAVCPDAGGHCQWGAPATWSVTPLAGSGALVTVAAGGLGAAESALDLATRLIDRTP